MQIALRPAIWGSRKQLGGPVIEDARRSGHVLSHGEERHRLVQLPSHGVVRICRHQWCRRTQPKDLTNSAGIDHHLVSQTQTKLGQEVIHLKFGLRIHQQKKFASLLQEALQQSGFGGEKIHLGPHRGNDRSVFR